MNKAQRRPFLAMLQVLLLGVSAGSRAQEFKTETPPSAAEAWVKGAEHDSPLSNIALEANSGSFDDLVTTALPPDDGTSPLSPPQTDNLAPAFGRHFQQPPGEPNTVTLGSTVETRLPSAADVLAVHSAILSRVRANSATPRVSEDLLQQATADLWAERNTLPAVRDPKAFLAAVIYKKMNDGFVEQVRETFRLQRSLSNLGIDRALAIDSEPVWAVEAAKPERALDARKFLHGLGDDDELRTIVTMTADDAKQKDIAQELTMETGKPVTIAVVQKKLAAYRKSAGESPAAVSVRSRSKTSTLKRSPRAVRPRRARASAEQ